MKPIFVSYANPMSNRNSFPDDQALNRLKVGIEDIRVSEHEAVITHALLANHVTCVKYKDSFMATIFSNLIVLPENINSIRENSSEEILMNTFQRTAMMIKSLLNNIPGFNVEFIAMMPKDIDTWLMSFYDACIYNEIGSELYSTMKSGMWHVQYHWDNPFTIDTTLLPWDIATNYLYDAIKDLLYSESYIDGLEAIKDMLENEIIKIEQHPYSKGSFCVLFKKQVGDRVFASCLSWFGNHSQIYEAGKNDLGLTKLFIVSNDLYIGSWFAVKEVGEKQYLRLDN